MFRVRAARTGLARAAAHRSSLLGRSEQIRPIAAVAMRGGAGVVGLLTAYVSFQVWQRLEWNQRRRIAARLKSPAKELSNFKTGPLWLQRHEKHAFISDLCNSDPGGPLLITGPRGTGKSMILRKAFSGRELAWLRRSCSRSYRDLNDFRPGRRISQPPVNSCHDRRRPHSQPYHSMRIPPAVSFARKCGDKRPNYGYLLSMQSQ